MITEKWHQKITGYVEFLQRYADRWWYPPLLGLLAALDNFIIVIPNDGLLISSSMLMPRRWFFLALFVGIGSTIGAASLAAAVEYQGLPWVLEFFPGLSTSDTWRWSTEFFDKYGLYVVFVVAITPLMQQPAVILAAMANTSLWQLAAVIFIGRFLKFLAMAYLGSHAPRLLKKMWGLKGELRDAGVEIKD